MEDVALETLLILVVGQEKTQAVAREENIASFAEPYGLAG